MDASEIVTGNVDVRVIRVSLGDSVEVGLVPEDPSVCDGFTDDGDGVGDGEELLVADCKEDWDVAEGVALGCEAEEPGMKVEPPLVVHHKSWESGDADGWKCLLGRGVK